jgi:hypothetical protein
MFPAESDVTAFTFSPSITSIPVMQTMRQAGQPITLERELL